MVNLYNFLIYPEEEIYSFTRKDLGYNGFFVLLLANISMACGFSVFRGATFTALLFSLTWGLAVKLA